LYQTIDQSDFYINKIDKNNRSDMNVTFHLINPQLNELFFKKASQKRLYFLKGHSIIGGIRASIYNAMPLKGVETLVKF
ncbi:MAG: phosphoserine transaminase, partial [Buchnera aphidicola]|nr:phosphoserine transaminase [Buchnera aphidicola]